MKKLKITAFMVAAALSFPLISESANAIMSYSVSSSMISDVKIETGNNKVIANKHKYKYEYKNYKKVPPGHLKTPPGLNKVPPGIEKKNPTTFWEKVLRTFLFWKD